MEARQGRRLAWSAAIFSIATGISRVLGLIRDVIASYYFGARGPINAFTVAFQIPNLIRVLVGDAALSGAFVPVFNELLEKGERARAWRVASSILWLLILVLTAVTAVFILLAPVIMPPLTKEYDELAVNLSQILFPIVVLLGASGIVVGILNTYGQFSIPALTPVAWNLVIILGLVIGVPRADTIDGELYIYAASIVLGTVVQVLLPLPWLRGLDGRLRVVIDGELYIYAASIVLGTVVQVLLPLPWLRGLDGRLRVVIDYRDPAVWRVFKLMIPVTVSLGLINLNAVIGTFVASALIDPTIAPTAIDRAFRIYMLPQGMFSVAVATVLFPTLSRLVARADMVGFRATVAEGLRQIGFLLIPASVFCAVLAEPLVRIVYQRGEFTPDQTPIVASALAAFSLGLTFNGMMLLLNRAFFGLQLPRIPTIVAGANLVLNTALYLVLYRVGVWGVPLAISIANIAGAAALLILLQRRVGGLELRRTTDAFLRITAASAALGVVSYAVWWLLDDVFGRGFLGQLISVGGAVTLGGLVYLGACRVLGVREMQTLLSLRARFRRP